MKKYSNFVAAFAVTTLILASSGAQAADATKKSSIMTPAPKTEAVSTTVGTTTTTRYTTEQTYPWGLGVATAPMITETPTAVTLWLGFDDQKAIQAYFGIDSTTPFNFGAGAVYKRVIAGNLAGGLHIGGGAGFGSRGPDEKFFIRLTGVAGLHFEMPGIHNVFVQADVGPSLLISSAHNNFQVGAFSPLLGLSLIYMF